jgi:hypothetical protein
MGGQIPWFKAAIQSVFSQETQLLAIIMSIAVNIDNDHNTGCQRHDGESA